MTWWQQEAYVVLEKEKGEENQMKEEQKAFYNIKAVSVSYPSSV